MERVREAGDGRTALELAQTLSPDIAIVDMSLPVMGELEIPGC